MEVRGVGVSCEGWGRASGDAGWKHLKTSGGLSGGGLKMWDGRIRNFRGGAQSGGVCDRDCCKRFVGSEIAGIWRTI